MFHKLYILVMMQLSEKFKLKSDLTFQQKLGKIAKFLFKMLISYGAFTGIFYVSISIFSINPTIYTFVFVITLMQLFGIIAQTTKLSVSLYMSKDNAILLTYPVKHELTYISKIVVAYIIELYRSILFVFPLFMAFMTIVSNSDYSVLSGAMDVANVRFFIFSVIFSVVLPLFPVLIGAILSIPLTYIKKAVKKFSIVKLLIVLIAVFALSYVTYLVVKALPDPLNVLGIWNKILTSANDFFAKFNRFSLHVQFVGNVMGGVDLWMNLLFLILIFVGLVLIGIFSSMPLFFKLASSSSEHAIVKNHKGKNKMYNSLFSTFMHKEILLSTRNVGDFVSDYLFLFIMPFVLIIMGSIFIRIMRNEFAMAATYPFLGFIALLMLSSASTASATAISSEGTEFVLLKTAPANSSKIIWPKLLINFIISFIFLTITFIFLTVIMSRDGEIGKLWIIYSVCLFTCLGNMMWSIQLDIMKPKLKEYANSENRSDVSNFSSSISIGLGVGLVVSLISMLVFILNLPLLVQGLLLGVIVLSFCGVRLYFLINFTNAYFFDIEL